MAQAKRRMGRPPKGPYADKRATLSTRITAEIRNRLEEASKKADRSLSQEIELRLEQSFRDEDQVVRQFGGERAYGVSLLLAGAVRTIETITGKGWAEDELTRAKVKEALCFTIDNLAAVRLDTPDDTSSADIAEKTHKLDSLAAILRGESEG